MAKFVPYTSATTSTSTWTQHFDTAPRQDVANFVLHCVGNIYFNTSASDTGRGYLSAGTYNFGPIDPSTVWVKAVTANTISGYSIIA